MTLTSKAIPAGGELDGDRRVPALQGRVVAPECQDLRAWADSRAVWRGKGPQHRAVPGAAGDSRGALHLRLQALEHVEVEVGQREEEGKGVGGRGGAGRPYAGENKGVSI